MEAIKTIVLTDITNADKEELATCAICLKTLHENDINMSDYPLDVCIVCEPAYEAEELNQQKQNLESKCEIAAMLVVSTGHITLETNSALQSLDFGERMVELDIIVYKKGLNGYFIVVEETEDFKGIPEDIVQIMILAKKNKCVWIMLDSDGPTIESLPIYEW